MVVPLSLRFFQALAMTGSWLGHGNVKNWGPQPVRSLMSKEDLGGAYPSRLKS